MPVEARTRTNMPSSAGIPQNGFKTWDAYTAFNFLIFLGTYQKLLFQFLIQLPFALCDKKLLFLSY
jgi:hypothetical protein